MLATLTHLPFRDKSFDLCLCVYGPLNHIPSIANGLYELKRVCKWRLVFSLYNKLSMYYLLTYIKRVITRKGPFIKLYQIKEVVNILKELGFRLVFWRGQLINFLKLHVFS